jgi:hypothetical protein
MKLRFLGIATLACLSIGSSLAATFAAVATASVSLTSGSGDFLVSDSPSVNLDVDATGDGSATAIVSAGGTGPYVFDAEAYGSATNGIASAASSATHQFIVSNVGNSSLTFTLAYDYSLSANGTGGGISEAGISGIGGLGNGVDQIFNDNTSAGSDSIVLTLLAHQRSAINITVTAEGYVQAVPEPATFAVVGLGMVGLMRRKRKNA